jgi:hypothetical protein
MPSAFFLALSLSAFLNRFQLRQGPLASVDAHVRTRLTFALARAK